MSKAQKKRFAENPPSKESIRKTADKNRGQKRSEEQKQRMSNARKNLSEKARQAISVGQKKRFSRPEELEKLRAKKITEETKMKISLANKGKKRSREIIQKYKEAQAKRKLTYVITDETKLKISKANKGKTVSKETRAKLSIIQKARWEKHRKANEKQELNFESKPQDKE